MKVYSISSPEQLRLAADMIKWDRDYRRVRAFADDWQRSGRQEKITLELGRSAQICREVNGKKTVLATIYVAAARDYAKELTET